MAREPHRITPALPVQGMQTYAALTPSATHFRPATCAEVDCPHYLNGWRSVIDENTDLGREQAAYIRERSGRRFREYPADFGVTSFLFEPGQRCFAQHETPLERDPVFLVRRGDWRGDLGLLRRHTRGEDWIDDMQTSLDATRQRLERG